MGSKKLIKKGFISALSACLVLSSSFNAYALKPLEWKKSIKIIDENGKELSTGANIERGTTLYADLYFSVDPQSYEVQWYVDGELEGTGEEFTVPEGDRTVGFYVSVEGEGPAELTSANKYFSFGTGQFYLMPGTGESTESGDSGSMGDSEKEEVTYTLELTGTPSASETLTGLFSPVEKVGGMGDISYIWYINGNATTSESGYKKESTTYTVNDWDEGEVYVEAYFEDINSESQQIQSNILTIEKDTEEGGTGDNTETGGTEEGGDTGAGDTGDTGNTDTGADDTGNTENGENAGNENTDKGDEAGDTDNKGDNETGDTGSGEGSEDGAGDTESGENTDDKDNTDSGTGEDGSLDDDINISTPSDAEKEENTGNNDNNNSEKDEEDKTDDNNSNIDTDNNNNSSNSSNSNNSNSHSSSSHISSKSINSEASEVYKWEFVNYKNENYKWFWKSNKGNIYKGWLQCPLDNYWYYFDLEEGYMLEGLQVIDGKTYYFQKQEETPSQTYYLEGGEWFYKVPEGGTNPWGSLLNIEL